MTVNERYETLKFLTNRSKRGNITPDRFNTIMAQAELEYFAEAIAEYETTQAVSDNLRNLKVRVVLTPTNGRITLPADYERITALTIPSAKDREDPVDIIDDDKWAYRTNSKVLPVAQNPIARREGATLKIIPGENRVALYYLREAVKPIWAFTVVNGDPVYDAANSVESDFAGIEGGIDIFYKMTSMLGLNLSKEEVVQYAEMKEAEV